MPSPQSIRIGVGAGTADDRIYPATQLAEHGELDYLVFECLAERTVARENLTRSKEPERGYTPRMLERIEAVLPACLKNDVRIVTNMGAANPRGGARAIRRLAQEHGCRGRLVRRGDGRRCQRSRSRHAGAEAARDWCAAGIDPAPHGIRQRLSRRRCRGQGAGDRRPDRHHRSCFRSVAIPRSCDARVRLELRRLAEAGGGPGCRPSPGVLRAGQRRLLRRSGQEGGAGPGHARLSLRRYCRRRQFHHRQARHQWWAGGRRDLHRAAAL